VLRVCRQKVPWARETGKVEQDILTAGAFKTKMATKGQWYGT